MADGNRKVRVRDRVSRAIPAPEANAELQANLDVSGDFFIFFLNTVFFYTIRYLFKYQSTRHWYLKFFQ